MPVPDPRDPRPVYEQIADDLRAAIKEGRLQPGDRLPTEREHAGRYGVAIMRTLRIAGASTVLLLGTFVFVMLRREKKGAAR